MAKKRVFDSSIRKSDPFQSTNAKEKQRNASILILNLLHFNGITMLEWPVWVFVYHLINFFSLGFGFYFVCSLQKWCYINQILHPGHFFDIRSAVIRIVLSVDAHSTEMQRNAHFVRTMDEEWEDAQKQVQTPKGPLYMPRMTLVFRVSRWARKKTYTEINDVIILM